MEEPQNNLPEPVVPIDYASPNVRVKSIPVTAAMTIGIICWVGFGAIQFLASSSGPGDNGGVAMALGVLALPLYLLSLMGLIFSIVGLIKTKRWPAVVAFLLNVAPTVVLLIALSTAF